MIGFLIPLLHVVISPFKTQARLEAEIVLLRHQLNVLRQRAPSKPKLTVADRLLFVWLYRTSARSMKAAPSSRLPTTWASATPPLESATASSLPNSAARRANLSASAISCTRSVIQPPALRRT
jgi:hypothetical protein